jgi:osmotically-inducible protein OsmY
VWARLHADGDSFTDRCLESPDITGPPAAERLAGHLQRVRQENRRPSASSFAVCRGPTVIGRREHDEKSSFKEDEMRRAGAAAVGLLALVLAAAPLTAAPARETLDDADIHAAIEGALLSDQMVPFDSIDVSVSEGVATLSGTVDTLTERQRAVMLTEGIKGVRGVVDRLEVRPVTRSDAQIRMDIEEALLMDPAAGSYDIDVSVRDGVATLSGTVDSWAEKQIARRVASDVKGVRDVDNQIEVEYAVERPDDEISAEIQKRLLWDARVDDALIKVAVNGGKVTLSGTVGSAAERTRAAGDAWVSGVHEVDTSGLKVEWWARDQMQRNKLVMRSDEEIARAVKDALLYDPRVVSFNPDVDVDDGVVTLSGVVDNLEAKRAAERDAHNTVGVVLVRNHLHVRPAVRQTDAEIRDQIEQALLLDPLVDRFHIGVSVFNGRAYLTGTVDRAFDKRRAESVTAGVEGVVDVTNNLVVTREPVYRSDYAIKRDIENELFWSPFVDAGQVNVEVTDGVATLTGTVDTWNERAWAAEDAREAGASSVRNQLLVKDDQGMAWMPYSF